MFVMPEHRNLVTVLLDEGFDVWCLDGRTSMRHSYNSTRHRTTFDDCALYDHPAAVAVVRENIGTGRLHVDRALHGRADVRDEHGRGPGRRDRECGAEQRGADPAGPVVVVDEAGARAGGVRRRRDRRPGPHLERAHEVVAGRTVSRVVSALHRECDVPACHLLSMMWGTGWPALYEHSNLDERTHLRAADLFGPSGLHYYRHMHQMVGAGAAVKYRPRRVEHRGLPDDYLSQALDIDTDLLLTTGSQNRVFTDSNVVLSERLAAMGGHRHELRVFEGYGHQDVFMGRDAAWDVFGHLVEFLSRSR